MSSKSGPLRQATFEPVISYDFFLGRSFSVCLYSTCCSIVNVFWTGRRNQALAGFLDSFLHHLYYQVWVSTYIRFWQDGADWGPEKEGSHQPWAISLTRTSPRKCLSRGWWLAPQCRKTRHTLHPSSFALFCKKITQLFPFDHSILFWKSFIVAQLVFCYLRLVFGRKISIYLLVS